MLNRPTYALNPSGSLLARELGHREIAVFRSDQDCPEAIAKIEVPGVGLVGLMFRSDHDLIAVTRDGHCVCWRVDADEETKITKIWSVEFQAVLTSFDRRLDSDRARFAVGDERGFVLLWDVSDDDPKFFLGHAHDDAVLYVRFDYQGNRLVSTGRDNLVAVWSCDPVTIRPPGQKEKVTADDVLDFFADEDGDGVPDRDIAELGDVSAQDVLDFFSAEIVAEGDGSDDPPEIEDVAPPEDADHSADNEADDNGFIPPPVIRTTHRLKGSEGWPLAAAFSYDGTRLVTGGMDNGVYLWRLGEEPTLEQVQYAHNGWIADLEWSAGDEIVVSASWDSTIGLFRGEDLEPTLCFEAHKDYVVDLEFIGDDTLISASYDNTIGVWNWREPKLVKLISGHEDWVEAVEPLGDGFLSMSSDGTAFKWGADLQPTVTVGNPTGAGIEVGAAVDLSEWVDATKLASFRPEEAVQNPSFAVRYRDHRSSGFTASSGKTAMSMLDDAMATRAPESEVPALSTEESKEEPAISRPEVETTESVPKGDSPKVKPALETAKKAPSVVAPASAAAEVSEIAPAKPESIEKPSESDSAPDIDEGAISDHVEDSAPNHEDAEEPVPALARPLLPTRKLLPPSRKIARPKTSNKSTAVPTIKPRSESRAPDEERARSVSSLPSEAVAKTNRKFPPAVHVGDELNVESDAEEFEPPDHDQWEGASKVMKDAGEFVRLGTESSRPILDGEPSEVSEVSEAEEDGFAPPFAAAPTPTAHPSNLRGYEEDAAPMLAEDDSANRTMFGFSSADSASAFPSLTSEAALEERNARPAPTGNNFPSNPTPTAFPTALSQALDDDVEEQESARAARSVHSDQTNGPWATRDPKPGLAESTKPRESKGPGEISSTALDDVEALAAELHPRVLKPSTPTTNAFGDVLDASADTLWNERSETLNSAGMGIMRPTRSRRKRAKTVAAGGLDARLRFKATHTIRTPHEWVYAVAINPKPGQGFASCGGDNTVCLWGTQGDLQHKLKMDASGHNALEFSVDGQMLAAGGDDGVVHLWLLSSPTASGPTKIKHAKLVGHSSWITSVAFGADGRLLVTGSYDGTARIWDLKRGKTIAELRGHEGPVSGVRVLRDRFLTCGHDGTVRIWTDNFMQIDQFDGYDMLLDCEFTDQSTCWAAANGEVYRVDRAHPRPLLRHRGQARGIAAREDGTVISVGEDGHAMIYAKDAREPHQSLRLKCGGWSVASRRKWTIVGGDDGLVHVFEVE